MNPLKKPFDQSKESNSSERNSKILNHKLSNYYQISNQPVSDNHFFRGTKGNATTNGKNAKSNEHDVNNSSQSIESVAPQDMIPTIHLPQVNNPLPQTQNPNYQVSQPMGINY